MRGIWSKSFYRYLAFSIVLIVLGAMLGYHQLTPTKAPENAKEEIISLSQVDSTEPSFSMTMSHVYQMAQEPHPSGSKEIEAVKKYLVEQFDTIGCSYEVINFEADMESLINSELMNYKIYMSEHPEDEKSFEGYLKELGFSTYEEKLRDDFGCGDSTVIPMTNFLVTVDVPASNQGVLFVSHYDSTKGGPGAGDDLIGVASMLEAIRLATLNQEQKNDLYFLFTDGEELGLNGAEQYVTTSPINKEEIELVINLEARGNSGSLVMFETSWKNKNIIRALNKALDHNLMFSFATAVYRLMPNDTDLTCFLEADYPGINFAMIGSPENYHASTDNYENLNRDSAYMYFQTTTKLARYFATADLNEMNSTEDAVFFPFLKGNTIILSNFGMMMLSYVIIFSSLLWIGFSLLKKHINVLNLLKALGIMLLTLLSTVLLGILSRFIYVKILDGKQYIEMVTVVNLVYYGFYILSVLIVILLFWLLGKKRQNGEMFAGSLILLSIFSFVCTQYLNGLSYIFTIPLTLMLISSILSGLKNSNRVTIRLIWIVAFLTGMILCILYIPVLDLLYTALLKDAIEFVYILGGVAVLNIAVLCKSLMKHNPVETEDMSDK